MPGMGASFHKESSVRLKEKWRTSGKLKRMATKKKKKISKPKKVVEKKTAAKKKSPRKKGRAREKSQNVSAIRFNRAGLGAGSGGQSGNLQGLSNSAEADSESVDELLEEGNAFEAEVVAGVESVPDADQGEVRTREVPEDDVPDEYRDQDK